MIMPKHSPRVLVVSHGHPSFSLGGAEIAAYNLHKGLNKIGGAESRFLARVGYPVVRHSGTALMSLRQKERRHSSIMRTSTIIF